MSWDMMTPWGDPGSVPPTQQNTVIQIRQLLTWHIWSSCAINSNTGPEYQIRREGRPPFYTPADDIKTDLFRQLSQSASHCWRENVARRWLNGDQLRFAYNWINAKTVSYLCQRYCRIAYSDISSISWMMRIRTLQGCFKKPKAVAA